MIYLSELYYVVRDATSMCDDIAKGRMGKNNWMKCPKKQSKYRQRVFIKLPLCIIHARRDKAKCFLIVWNRAALGLLSFLTSSDSYFVSSI